MARRSLIEWISRCDKSTVSLGVSGGYIGYAYLFYSMFKDEKWYKKWKSMIDDQFSKRAYQLLLQYEYYNDHRFLDALNGVVCIDHYLIQTGYMEKDFYSTIYNSLLNRICKIINETDSNIDLGIAHGILGLLAVAYECEVLLNYHHDSSVRIAEKYYKLFDNDSIEFPEYVCLKNKKKPEYKKSKKFGWCYGSLETLNILYTIFKETNKVEEMINSGVHGVFTLSTELMYANFIFEFYDLLNNEKTNIGTEKIDHIDKIELKNVSYEYTSGKSDLKNINCEFSAGNNYAIIEKNGSGKSMLIKLLSGLYDDYSGQILINGIDLKKIDIESYFQTISVQYQDFNNYEMNVEKNILIGNINDNTKDENKFNEVTTMTGVDDFVSVMPEKYNQQLGSWFKDGRQLSGGQWQKIAMARCIYRPASLYLFDEATSALDLMSEKKFYDMLKSRNRNQINLIYS